MNCRGHAKRQWIVDHYRVKPEAHLPLLNGQTKRSDAGQVIENNYYVFKAKNNLDNVLEVIQCGSAAARDFLDLLHLPPLPLFNPLSAKRPETQTGDIMDVSAGRIVERNKNHWHPETRQLYNAIMWIIMLFDGKPNTPIFDIKTAVEQGKDQRLEDKYFKAVNTILQRILQYAHARTLSEKIAELSKVNEFRPEMCQFDLIKNRLSVLVDAQGNKLDLVIYF
ncbi:hypothetical protein PT286_06695 [Neisseriaceae bacterium ESL0693]|nr:hypothetical protein [Neisseriaceae bacterium ESL0693]